MFQNYTRNKCQTVNNALRLILKRLLLDHSLKRETLRPLPGHRKPKKCAGVCVTAMRSNFPPGCGDPPAERLTRWRAGWSRSGSTSWNPVARSECAPACWSRTGRELRHRSRAPWCGRAAQGGSPDSLLHSLSSSFFLWGRSHGRTSAAAVNISHPHTHTHTLAHVMRFPCRKRNLCKVELLIPQMPDPHKWDIVDWNGNRGSFSLLPQTTQMIKLRKHMRPKMHRFMDYYLLSHIFDFLSHNYDLPGGFFFYMQKWASIQFQPFLT